MSEEISNAKPDFADRFTGWLFCKYPGWRRLEPFYRRHKALALYGFFGLGTAIIAIGGYAFLTEVLLVHLLLANAIAWFFATLFAFFTNRRWVFIGHPVGVGAFIRQFFGFGFGRLITLFIEEWMLYYMIGVWQLPNMPVKFLSQVIVIALNYFISNLIVFRKRSKFREMLHQLAAEERSVSARLRQRRAELPVSVKSTGNVIIKRGNTMTYENAKQILERHGQEHVLREWDSLSGDERGTLLTQIEAIDWDVIAMAGKKEEAAAGEITPLSTLTLSMIDEKRDAYREKGLAAIREGRIGAVLLAGGMGTRLGSDRPKGELNVGLTRKLPIFNCLINNLMEVTKEAQATVPLFVMTSEKNDADTRAFFAENDYFGYDGSEVYFFIQEMAPAVDYDGKLLMEEAGRLATSPNGNGGWFSSLKKAGLLDTVHEKGIEYINIFAVDNVLQRIADPVFIGATLDAGVDCGSKVVMKNDPHEKVGVMCLEDGRPSIVEYYDLNEEMANARDESGAFVYGAGVILNYLFSVKRLEEIVDVALPVHVVEKKIPYIDESGHLIKPEEPNGYKFENLAVDLVRLMEGCIPFEVVREREFAPIKNLHGVDSLDSARELLAANGVGL